MPAIIYISWVKELTYCQLPWWEGLVTWPTNHIFVFLARDHVSFRAHGLRTNANTDPHCFKPYVKDECHVPRPTCNSFSIPARICRTSWLGCSCCLLKASASLSWHSLTFPQGTILAELVCSAVLSWGGINDHRLDCPMCQAVQTALLRTILTKSPLDNYSEPV